MRRVKIIRLPNKAHGGPTGGAADGIRRFLEGKKNYDRGLNQFAEPDFEVNKTISGVPREEANIEAEGGETAIVPGSAGIPESYKITGPRHSGNGVPLNLAPDSFIFSDNKKGMKIKDRDMLAEFGMSVPKKGRVKGKTPAEISRKFDLNDYKKTLMDPNSDKLERETAELMIKNYNMKLGKLALVQESMKGYPQSIPAISMPYLQSVGVDPNQVSPQGPTEGPSQGPTQAAYGAAVLRNKTTDYSLQDGGTYGYNYGGENKTMARRFPGLDIAQRGGEMSGAFWDSILGKGGVRPAYQTGGEFKPHMMYAPETRETIFADTYEKHLSLEDQDYVHEDQLAQAQQGGSLTTYPGLDASPTLGPGTTYPGLDPTSQPTGNLAVIGDTPKEDIKAAKETTSTYNVPEKYRNNSRFDQSSDDYDPNTITAGDYVKQSDGKWYKVIPKDLDLPEYQQEDIKSAFAGDKAVANKYAYLEKTFSDPDIRKAFGEKTRAALKNDQYYARKQGAGSKQGFMSDKEIDALTDDQIMQHHLDMQKRNYALGAQGIDPKHFSDKNGNVRPEFKEHYEARGIKSLSDAFEQIGLPLGKQGEDKKIGIEQATYWGYKDLIKDKANMSPEMQEKLKAFKAPDQWGASDEGQTGSSQISPIDMWYTDTSAGELDPIDLTGTEFEEAEKVEPKTSAIAAADPQYAREQGVSPWWLQDQWNVANLVGQRLGIKKQLPTSFPIDLARPDVLYHDPSRALAASAEQSAIAQQAASAFAGPQAATSRASGIAGQAFAQQANILADYESRNVAVGNQYLDKVKQTADQESLYNAERMKKLYDEWTIANQQFDNTKRAMNRNITQGIIQGKTNQMQAQAMNTLYPQFKTDPGRGGGLHFTEGRKFVDTGSAGSSDNSYLASFQSLKNKFPGAPDSAIKQQLDMSFGQPNTNQQGGPDRKALMQMYSGMVNPTMYQG